MKHHILVALLILVCATAYLQSQTPPQSAPARSAADTARIQQIQQQMQPLQQQLQPIQLEIESVQQRLKARYPGDLSPDQLQQRLQSLQQQRQGLQQQMQPMQAELQKLGVAGGRGGFGFGAPERGGRGPVTVPPNATPEQLRLIIEQQNQTITRLQAAAQPPAAARPAAPPPCVPVNPNATQEAKDLLKKICDVTGKGILTGQHDFPNNRNADQEAIHEATGKYPAIWGSDFGFTDGEDKDAITHRDLLIEEAKRQHAAGSIIYFCWHMTRPTEDEPVKPGTGWSGSVQAKLTEDQWQELIASDSPLHQRWEKYMDTAAKYLKQLQDAKIPVLWRPMHENNGTFFWWGGHPGPYGTAMLYREVYNRMVNVHHLNNLVWVWNQNGPAPGGEFYDFYPGAQYADIVSYDNYGSLDERYYHEILTLANGKPIGFGELGSVPPVEVLAAQPKWAFYMTWAGMAGAGGQGGPGGATAAAAPKPIPVPANATVQQLRDIIQQLRAQQPSAGRGGRGATVYPIPESASANLLRKIIARLQPGASALKVTYDDPYFIKRGDPMPKESTLF